MLSTLALVWNFALSAAYGWLFLTSPTTLLSFFYNGDFTSITTIDPFLDSICKYFAVALFTHAFLYIHYIPFTDKQGPGLRMAMMLSMGYIMVAMSKLVPEGATLSPESAKATLEALFAAVSGGEQNGAAVRTLAIQGATFVVSFVGMRAAPKPVKDKSKKA
jgi:hypothetical protein